MNKWIWGAVLLASGCIVVDEDKKDNDNTGADTDTDTDTPTIPDPDDDGDGFPASADCNDADAAINPDALEACDTIDNNCDSLIDDAAAATIGGTTNFATIDEAVAAAVDGDTLEVCPGDWEVTSISPSGVLTLHSMGGRDVTSLHTVDGSEIVALGGTSSLTIDGFTLSGSVGAAIELSDSPTLSLKASRLTGNGQGILIDTPPPDAGTLAVEGTDIDTNNAGNGDGGGINAVGSFDITLTDSNLTGNSAANGGAIFARVIFGLGNITASGTLIDSNNADIGGGVVLQNVTLTGDGATTISNNTASTAGGGVAMYAASLASVLVSTNDAPQGGGIAALQDDDFEGAPYANPLVSVIVDSNTGDLGAGLWVDNSEAMSVDAYSAVTLNVAATTGGGAYLDGPTSAFSSAGANFGAAGTNDNSPDDVFTTGGLFAAEPGAVFTCTGASGCSDGT